MDIKKIIFLFYSMLFLLSCERNEKKNSYEVNGLLHGVEDSTMVYMANDELLDSSMVIKERFRFQGSVEGPTRVALYTKKQADRVFFWLENSAFTIEAEKGKVRFSSISGGKVQETANILFEETKLIGRTIDSLVKVLEKENFSNPKKDSLVDFYHGLVAKQELLEMNFIKSHPNSLEAILTLDSQKREWEKEKVKELFSRLKGETKKTKYGKSVKRYLDLHQAPEIGEEYIDFVQVDKSGERKKFSATMGARYTLIDFWASWCLPCRKANPALIELYNEYSSKGFNIVGVSIDEDKKSWLKAIEQDELPWTNLTDLKGVDNEAYIIYGVDGIPDNILINEEGIIVGRNLGKEVLRNKLLELL